MNQLLSARHLAGAASLVFAFALFSAPGLRAQENNPCASAANPCAMKDAAAMDEDAMDDAAEMEAWMSKVATKLDLSEEQVAQIKPILMASHESHEAIMAKYDGEQTEAAETEMAALKKQTMYKLDEVLTEEQMDTFHSMMNDEDHGEKHDAKKMEKKEKKSGY